MLKSGGQENERARPANMARWKVRTNKARLSYPRKFSWDFINQFEPILHHCKFHVFVRQMLIVMFLNFGTAALKVGLKSCLPLSHLLATLM